MPGSQKTAQRLRVAVVWQPPDVSPHDYLAAYRHFTISKGMFDGPHGGFESGGASTGTR